MRSSSWPIVLMVLVLVGASGPARGDAAATLQRADRAMNRGDTDKAEALYQRAYSEAKRQADERLATEIVNSLCAVDLARGDLKKLHGHRVWANKRKAAEEPAADTPSQDNLLANGGFEDGFTKPWGTGHYERKQAAFGTWWNSSDPQGNLTYACMKVDRDVRHSGQASLRVTNTTPAGHNLFTTTAQRIEGLEPHSVFRLRLFAKADKLVRGAVKFTVDAGWEIAPLVLPHETYDWKELVAYFSNGFNDVVDFRIIHQDVGTIWLDDISIEKIRFDQIPNDPAGRALQARVLADRGDHAAALLILDRMIAENEKNNAARFQRGQIHLEAGSYEAAITDLQPLAETGNGEAQMYVGDALAGLHRLDEARHWYEASYPALKNNQLKAAQVKGRLARIYIEFARNEKDGPRSEKLYRLAERYLGDNRLVSAHIGDGASLLDVTHLRAVRALQAGNLDAALASFREGFSAYETRGRQLARLPARRRALILNRYGPFLDDYINALYEASLASPTEERSHKLAREAFPVAQYRTMTEANLALAQMAARRSAGDDTLGRLLRQRQDLASSLSATEQRLTNAIAKNDEREMDLVNVLKRQVRDIAASLERIEAELERDHRDFDQLANPQPLSIDTVQDVLEAEEALVLIDSDAAMSWVITKTEISWQRASRSRAELANDVAALRCGLDRAAWTSQNGAHCSTLLGGRDEPNGDEPLPFDLDRANALYRTLFGHSEALVRGKRLVVIQTGSIAELPLQVLVTETPAEPVPADAADYAKASWLIRHHALTVLPSVTSLETLRRLTEPSKAKRPFVGFGNPLLLGRNGTDRRAFKYNTCDASSILLAAEDRGVGAVADRTVGDISTLFERGLGNVAVLRLQSPLPETAYELCTVAQTVGAQSGDVRLGTEATEAKIKGLSRDGALSDYRIVHFATHGLVAGETESVARALAEPALLLTPPDMASELDDGLLTASEVAALRLDADWVVLSACNTAAAGEKGSAEALSGLARAFFYAGTRALLVSHWYVDSRAAVQITTGAFAALGADPRLGRAEALRRATLAAMLDPKRPSTWTPASHPAIWAPFIVVGEGRGDRR